MASLIQVFGTHLRQARKLKGWTQSELAEAAELSLDMIGRMERGTASPSLETIEALAAALDVGPATLFGGRTDASRSGKRAKILERIDGRLAKANDQELALVERVITAALSKPGTL